MQDPESGADISWLVQDDMHADPSDTNALKGGGGQYHSIAAENVHRTLLAAILRCLPSDSMLQRSSATHAPSGLRQRKVDGCAVESNTVLHAWPQAMSMHASQIQHLDICTAALDVVCYHLRNVLWMSSHHFTDFASQCAAAVAPEATPKLLEELCDVLEADLDPRDTPSPRIHALLASNHHNTAANTARSQGRAPPSRGGRGGRRAGPGRGPHGGAAPVATPAPSTTTIAVKPQPVHVIVGAVQSAAAELYDAQQAVKRWKILHEEASKALLVHLDTATSGGGYGGAVIGNSFGSHAISERVRNVTTCALTASRKWVDASVAYGETLLARFCSGILSIEASRAGSAWAPGT